MVKLELPDALLVTNYMNGDESALELLIHRHKSKIYGFIHSKVQDREVCEDIFQDTFIKVIKNLKKKSYNEEGKFLPWVMRIAHNLVIDFFRKNKKMPLKRDTDEYSVFSLFTDSELTIENKMIADQIESDVTRIIEELPEDQKQVLKLRMYDDMSFKEISEVTGVSINTALGRMRYAIINLRKIIEKNNIVLTT